MISLVLGGARSGKSAVAEELTKRHGPPITYVATMLTGGDPDLEARVAAHRLRRDPAWTTVQADEDLAQLLAGLDGTVLVDSLGPWVAGLDDFETDGEALCSALLARDGDTVLVSDEVGLSVHPTTAQGLRFRDALGAVNLTVSSLSDRVYLVVAGRVLVLPAVGASE